MINSLKSFSSFSELSFLAVVSSAFNYLAAAATAAYRSGYLSIMDCTV